VVAARLRELARLFLTVGVVGVGGPAAHVALMHDQVVRRRAWLDDAEFVSLVGATALVPGPNSTELAIHLGHRRAGVRGLLLGGCCFIVPSVVIVSVLAWSYRRFGTDPIVVDLRYGILPPVIAVIAHALVGLARTACRRPVGAVVAVAALGGSLAGVHELLLLVMAGAATTLWACRGRLWRTAALGLLLFPPLLLLLWSQLQRLPAGRAVTAAPAPDAATPVSTWRLFAVFIEIGSVLYGSGYVLVAFLQRNLVDQLGWLTGREVLDAVAVGQVTPGPLFSTATFVGWQIDGPRGAVAATVGIFLPSFLFVALLGRIVPWMRSRPAARTFLDGVTAASLGLMAAVLVELADTALVDAVTVVVAVVSLALLMRTRVNSAWLLGAGAIIGIVHTLAG